MKIGYAAHLEDRLASLNRSVATPLAFRAYAIYEVDQALTDKRLHDLIDFLNPELRSVETFDGKVRKREFFRMSKEEAFRLLECIAQISGTRSRLHLVKPEGHELAEEMAAEEVRKTAMKPPFAFSMVGMVLMMRLGRSPRQLAANRSMCIGILARESNGILRSKSEEGVAGLSSATSGCFGASS